MGHTGAAIVTDDYGRFGLAEDSEIRGLGSQ